MKPLYRDGCNVPGSVVGQSVSCMNSMCATLGIVHRRLVSALQFRQRSLQQEVLLPDITPERQSEEALLPYLLPRRDRSLNHRSRVVPHLTAATLSDLPVTRDQTPRAHETLRVPALARPGIPQHPAPQGGEGSDGRNDLFHRSLLDVVQDARDFPCHDLDVYASRGLYDPRQRPVRRLVRSQLQHTDDLPRH